MYSMPSDEFETKFYITSHTRHIELLIDFILVAYILTMKYDTEHCRVGGEDTSRCAPFCKFEFSR